MVNSPWISSWIGLSIDFSQQHLQTMDQGAAQAMPMVMKWFSMPMVWNSIGRALESMKLEILDERRRKTAAYKRGYIDKTSWTFKWFTRKWLHRNFEENVFGTPFFESRCPTYFSLHFCASIFVKKNGGSRIQPPETHPPKCYFFREWARNLGFVKEL